MFRSPSRNNRSKRVKIKHVLQICLLLGVCFWLIYQVKHSHDKKKEFDEKDGKLSVKGGDEPKFGRKDLHPRKEGVTKNEKHGEEEVEETGVEEEENKHDEEEPEEESKHDEEEPEEENKPEITEQEEEENKGEEAEDEERGGGDDEIDENDQEKSDGEADHDEGFIDEEKEREEDDEKESEEKQSQAENENSLEDQDHDGDDPNTHEAREEHYKGDDASSAVTHDTQTIISENEKLSSENNIEQSEMNILEQENKSNNTQEIGSYERTSAIKVGEGEMAKSNTSLILISAENNFNDSSTNTMGRSDTNSTMTTQSSGHPEGSNNTTLVRMEPSNPSAEVSTEALDIKEVISGSSQQNETVTLSDSPHAQNMMANSTNAGNSMSVQTLETEQTSNTSTVSESNQSDVNSTSSIKFEKEDVAAGESSTLHNNSELAVLEKITTEAEDGSLSSESKENIDATKDKKLESNSESDGNDESSENFSRDESLDAVQHDPIDMTDSHIGLVEKEVRTDLDTLPEIKTEGDNSDYTAAE
jgi:hypothetical protein